MKTHDCFLCDTLPGALTWAERTSSQCVATSAEVAASYRTFPEDGNTASNPIFGGGGFIGRLSLTACKAKCLQNNNQVNAHQCAGVEWSNTAGESASSTVTANCALAWACTSYSGWSGGNAYLMECPADGCPAGEDYPPHRATPRHAVPRAASTRRATQHCDKPPLPCTEAAHMSAVNDATPPPPAAYTYSSRGCTGDADFEEHAADPRSQCRRLQWRLLPQNASWATHRDWHIPHRQEWRGAQRSRLL